MPCVVFENQEQWKEESQEEYGRRWGEWKHTHLFSISMMEAWILWCRMCICWSCTARLRSMISSTSDSLSRYANTSFFETLGTIRTLGEVGDGGDPGSSQGARSKVKMGPRPTGPPFTPDATHVPPHSPASCGQGSERSESHVPKRSDKSKVSGDCTGRVPQPATRHGPAFLHLGSHSPTLLRKSHCNGFKSSAASLFIVTTLRSQASRYVATDTLFSAPCLLQLAWHNYESVSGVVCDSLHTVRASPPLPCKILPVKTA